MWIEIGLLFLTFIVWLYWFVSKNFGKWEKHGIPCISGSFPHGSNSELLSGKEHFNFIMLANYQKFKDKDYYGTYLFGKPLLNINNVDMVRDILVKHFNNFVDRNDSNFAKVFDGGDMDQMWNNQLTTLSGDAWKDVRSTFTPIFTSGKMKGMLRFMQEIGTRLSTELADKAEQETDFELKDVFGKFSLDTLATCAFGIDPQSFTDKNSTFVKAAARLLQNSFSDAIWSISRLLPGMQKLQKRMNISIIKPKETAFFADVIRKTVEHRRKTGVRENDLVDLMIDCIREEGEVAAKADTDNSTEIEEEDQYESDMRLSHTAKKQFDETTIVATALVLLIAGYDTTGMTLSYLAYELAKNPDTQDKLQQEIDEVFENLPEGKKFPDYATIQGMEYLDSCIYEALRTHTPVGNIFRCCNTDIKLEGMGDYVIKKDDLVNISAIGIHNDERYYPNPSQFNPDNFSKKARQSRSPYTFLGFGQGPRACMGMRFAILEAKVALIQVLRKFTFLPSSKNPETLKVDPHSQLGYVKDGLWAKIQKRN